MSLYVDYTLASSEYDNQMTAVGSDVIVGMIQTYTGKQLRDVHVLDAGCGTGNYAKSLLDAGIGCVTLLDGSSSMLDKARTKLVGEVNADRATAFVEAKMPPLPFSDSSFDAVIFSLVLHHMNVSDDGTYPMATETLCEARRVLQPGGLVIIGTILPSTCTNAIWYTQFNKAFTDRVNKLLPSLDHFNTMFNCARLKCCQQLNILGSDMVKDYHRYDGPLDAAWRQAVSYWLYATDAELDDVKNKISRMKQDGTLDTWCRQHDTVATTGYLTLLFCKAK